MTSITIMPVRVADLLAEGERMPVYVHVIDHPDARVLVDTGMTELHPAVADLDPRLSPLSEQDFNLTGIDIVVNTHLHFDHCGGNHLFAGRPIYVQRGSSTTRAARPRLHHSRLGRGARRAVRAGRRRSRAASRAPTRPGAGPHTWHAGDRRRDGRASGRRRRRRGGLVGAASTSRTPRASSGCARSTPSWSGSRTSTSRGDPAPSKASRRRSLGLRGSAALPPSDSAVGRADEGPRRRADPAGHRLARPTGVGRALATYEIPIEGRDEWLAAARRLA